MFTSIIIGESPGLNSNPPIKAPSAVIVSVPDPLPLTLDLTFVTGEFIGQ